MTANMVWFTAATLLAVLGGVCALEKQIKLEDIERDNLQTELLKQTQRAESGQPQAYAYHQQHQPQQQLQQQQPQQQPQHSYHTLPQLQQHLQQQDRQQQLAQQHHLLLAQHNYQSPMLQPQHVMPTIMYLIMPNGNVAALQLAPHPNHLQPYYGAATKQVPGTLYHQLHGQQQHQQLAVPMQILQYYQPPVPQIQYVPQTTAQRYQPHQAAVVQHQTQHIFSSPQAQQAHAQHFSSLAPGQQHLLFREAQESVVQAPSADLSAYGAQSQGSLGVPQSPQSHKSAYVSGAKSTASPQLKGSFSTQTGSSYANFRQYG